MADFTFAHRKEGFDKHIEHVYVLITFDFFNFCNSWYVNPLDSCI